MDTVRYATLLSYKATRLRAPTVHGHCIRNHIPHRRHLVGNFGGKAIELALEAAMLAQLVREVGNEALLALLDGEYVRSCRPQVIMAGGDDAVRGRHVVAAEVRCELHAGQLDGLAEEHHP